MRSMMAELGVTTQVRVWTDSNAAKAIASRRGLGKTRHVKLRYLWCEWEGDVVAVVAPLGGVAQVVRHGVKVVGVHGEEGQEKDGKCRWK